MPSFSITFSGGTISTISGFSSKIVRILPHAAAAWENVLIQSPAAIIGHTSISMYELNATNWPIETCPSSTILPPARSVTITLIPITASSVGPKTARSFTTARFFSLLFSQAFSNCLKSSSSCANALTTRIPAMLSCTLSDRYEKASCLFT